MTLIEAIKTKQRITRKAWNLDTFLEIAQDYRFSVNHGMLLHIFDVFDIQADDWEIYDDSPKSTISEKQLEDALSLLVGDAALEVIKEKLGF